MAGDGEDGESGRARGALTRADLITQDLHPMIAFESARDAAEV
jgi:hypothetical protein